jgi:hypothetical protein
MAKNGFVRARLKLVGWDIRSAARAIVHFFDLAKVFIEVDMVVLLSVPVDLFENAALAISSIVVNTFAP